MTMTPMEKIVSIVFDTAVRLGIRLMLVGAAARDFWLNRFEIGANIRTTHDVDLACLVGDWDGYNHFIQALMSEGGLLPDPLLLSAWYSSAGMDRIADASVAKRIV